MKYMMIAVALAALGGCAAVTASAPPAPITPVSTPAPAGVYDLDLTHTSVHLRVKHLGMSNYTLRFKTVRGQLTFDPAAPQNSSIAAVIDAKSLETDYPLPKPDFNAMLTGPDWLDAGAFPEIAFKSTNVELTAANAARVTGDLTLHGVTKPIVLDVTFNNGAAGMAHDPRARVGFSARGQIVRSEFGVSRGVPPPGQVGVGDEVEIIIEAEFAMAKS